MKTIQSRITPTLELWIFDFAHAVCGISSLTQKCNAIGQPLLDETICAGFPLSLPCKHVGVCGRASGNGLIMLRACLEAVPSLFPSLVTQPNVNAFQSGDKPLIRHGASFFRIPSRENDVCFGGGISGVFIAD